MKFSETFDRLHLKAKENLWMWLFSVFCRIALATGFFPAGMVKIVGERFASGVSANHPMGHYLEALHQTGFYYTFIGVLQAAAAVMLLIPRTVTLGAFIYFPIILNICILTYATRFDGSLFTAPLMVLANLYVLGWNYEKWKYILPFNRSADVTIKTERIENDVEDSETINWRGIFSRDGINSLYTNFRAFFGRLFKDKFPTLFFAGVFTAVVVCGIGVPSLYSVKPRNNLLQCLKQFQNTSRTKAGETFCGCIHKNGESLAKCLGEYENAADDTGSMP